jgi:formamidopyrimidine-DNA glycosylase
VIKGGPIPSYKSFKISEEWPPKFTKLEIFFSNGIQLAFCDPRRLGRIRIRSDPLLTNPIADLARDPFTEDFDHIYVQNALSMISAPIKSVLLDQGRVFCGIGNWIADEILYQAGIHPSRACKDISELEIRKLTEKTKYIISTAVKLQTEGSELPENWLFHRRWDKKTAKGKVGGIKMPNGQNVSFETVAGRTSAVVLSVQKKSVSKPKKVGNSDIAISGNDEIITSAKRGRSYKVLGSQKKKKSIK